MTSQTQPRWLVWLLATLAAFSPLSIDTYLPSLPDIARELGTRDAQVQLTIGAFLAGLCSGMLLYGPLSDRYGRRRLMLGSLLLYILASAGCIWVTSVEQLIVLRFLQAVGGAGALVLARTVVRDLYPLSEAARVLSLMHVIAMVATLLAPIMGTYLVLLGGWRIIFVMLFLLGAGCLFAVATSLQESLPVSSRTQSVLGSFHHYVTVLRDPLALCYILAMGLSVGGMFAFITASPFLFIHHFGFSPRAFSLLFGLNIVGIIVATIINARLVRRLGPLQMLGVGSVVAACAGALLIVIGLTGWGQPFSITGGVLLFMGISGLIGANCIASLMGLFPGNAGAAVGLGISLQFACGALFSWLVSVLADGTARPMCLVIGFAGLGSLACYRAIRHLMRQPQRQAVRRALGAQDR
ncbi:Bcr/CflA family drug resistance efflux transporter [Pseudomonas straminea]|uniref:Bcr/CflA family efflux transporter n=1 Tax=Pseudomonas straminea TaxID=47882 RepID=A0A1I1TK97_PSEOC|nr:multidrug effflux MFS transporter [Pseudomonas straminea]GLX13103.1 Bcr/CflA family drug resistance efflux transporter [Pseudomonas straminea]SFD59066.1 MFS transporter, DHA1 family, bicyclomycin/chloramphenicol resistance protein [Pseudomonas straminea]